MITLRRTAQVAAAAALVAGSSLVGATSASAQANCTTVEGARMCANVVWPGGNTYYGRATVTDVNGGPNLNVAVTNIRLQHYNGSSWVTVRETYDYDGYFGGSDTGQTTAINPCNYRNPVFRTVAYVQWNGGQSGARTIYSGAHGHTC